MEPELLGEPQVDPSPSSPKQVQSAVQARRLSICKTSDEGVTVSCGPLSPAEVVVAVAVDDARDTIYKFTLPKTIARRYSGYKYRYIFMKKASNRSEDEALTLEQVMNDNKMFSMLEVIKERVFMMFDTCLKAAGATD